MSLYYDRQGKPLTDDEWSTQFRSQEAKRVAETTLPDGTWISTVWLGLDHSFGAGPPLIFETMVFEKGCASVPDRDNDMDRYSTEQEALDGHKRMVEKWSKVAS